MRHPMIIAVLLVGVAIVSWLPGVWEPGAGQSGSTDPVLVGARMEIVNRTRYNRKMLDRYYPPVYQNGIRHDHAIYPGGDIHPDQGVCSDLVVRALRHAGVDLQRAVHEDLSQNREAYGTHTSNRFIDHRRVWILLRYFYRHFIVLPNKFISVDSEWQPGDIVVWRTGSASHLHIGVVSDRKARFSGRPLAIHNAPYFPFVFPGRTVEQDVLTGVVKLGVRIRKWQIIGHFRVPTGSPKPPFSGLSVHSDRD